MKTKLFNSFAAAAMSVLALSCAKEPVGGGIEAGVSFSVEVPGEQMTKAEIGDGETATKLYYQVFDENGAAIDGLGVQNTALSGKTATVNFQLVKDQTYNFIFWAQTATDGYYTIDDAEGLKKITANYTGKNSNDENFDAFYAVKENVKVTGPVSQTVKLTRPFAQINIATVGQISAGTTTKDIDFKDAESKVTVKGIPTVFSPLAKDKFTVNEDVTFAKAAAPAGNITVNSKDYKYLAVNYVFAPTSGTVYDIEATLKIEGKDVSLTVPTVPAKQNWKTNIVGDLLTTGADFVVVVVPGFAGSQNYDEYILKNAIAQGGDVTISKDITVTDRLSLPKGKVTNITVEEGVTLTGELENSKSTKVISLFNSNIKCNLAGEGTILSPTVNLGQYSVAAAIELEDNTNELTIDGDLTIKGRDGTKAGMVDAGMIIRAGKVVVNSGHFIAGRDVNGDGNPAILLYSPSSYRSELIINGGTFESTVGNNQFLINIQDEYRDNASVKIYGGKFKGFDPANVNEGTITSFVPAGYKSTLVGEYYVVTKEDITPVNDQAGFNDAVAKSNTTVLVPAGTFAAPTSVADGVTIEGVDGTVIDIPAAVQYPDKNITFKSLTVKSPNANYIGIQHAASVKYVDCTIEGQPFSYATEAVYENCKFVQTSNDAYNIWTYGTINMTFNDCVFNCAGKSVLVYNEGAVGSSIVTFNNCVFKASEKVSGKAAIEVDQTYTNYVVYINKCTASGFDNGSKSNSVLWNNKKGVGDSLKSLKVVVDGVEQTLN